MNLAVDGDSIDKSAVVAVEVDEFILIAGLLDGAVPARDRGIDEAQLIGFIAADGYLAVDELPGRCR